MKTCSFWKRVFFAGKRCVTDLHEDNYPTLYMINSEGKYPWSFLNNNSTLVKLYNIHTITQRKSFIEQVALMLSERSIRYVRGKEGEGLYLNNPFHFSLLANLDVTFIIL